MTRLSGKSDHAAGISLSDMDAAFCHGPDKAPALPRHARLPINRCNLPAAILGGLTFQRAPTPLYIDGIADLHQPLFQLLDDIDTAAERARRFTGYLQAHFHLAQPEDAGLSATPLKARPRASYLRVVRGWAFDPDGREAAVLKGWVESRFGLMPRHHGGSLREPGSAAWQSYMHMRASGLYGTNALENQLDLLYAYSQYELARQFPRRSHLRLYRGINRLNEHETIAEPGRSGATVVLLNNISSFSRSSERAGEFGDHVLSVDVPVAKLAFYSELLPGMLKAEDEYVVIGGLYRVRLAQL